MSLSTAAIVVSHNRPDLLAACLRGLEEQTLRPDQTVVVETSESAECAQLALDFGAALVQPGAVALGAAIESGRLALAQPAAWLWVLHDDAVAQPWALERLSKTAEVSPSVAIVGGKLLDAARPGVIQQLGLTATQSGNPFLLVQDEFDQGQHDAVSDSLAVSTAGMLIRNRAWQELGGLRDDVPIFAADIDLGVRARVSGYRVIVEPAARILHHGLSMSGGRSRAWLGGSRWYALRRAQLHLGFSITRLPVAILLAILAPLTGLLRAVGQIAQKRPQRFLGELIAPLELWLRLPRAIAARRRISALGTRANLSGLFATTKQQRARRQARLRHLPASAPGEVTRGLVSTGSWWLGLVALVVNLEMVPRGEAILQPLRPLGESLQSVFAATATSGVPALGGQAVPSDSFNWVLTALALLSPTGPSIALAVFIFAAGPIAFWGAWQLMSLFSDKIWLRNLLGLGYAVNPLLLAASRELMPVDLVAMTALPWVLFLSVRVALAETPARSWRWLGLAGLAFAVLAVSSVVAAALVVVVILGLAAVNWRRTLILIWIPVGGLALLAPGVFYALHSAPELALATSWLPALDFPSPSLLWLLGLPLVFFAGWVLVSRRWLLAATLWLVAGLAGATAVMIPVGSAALLAALWLAMSALSAMAVGLIRRQWLVVPLAAVLVLGPTLALTERPDVEWGEARVAPALVTASAAAGEQYRTLIIRDERGLLAQSGAAASKSAVAAELRYAGAGYLESSSMFIAALAPQDPLSGQVADVTARLLSGNENRLSELLQATGVGFVLIELGGEELQSNLESLPQLADAGETRWGKLYRVISPQGYQPEVEPSPWRPGQLAVLAAYLLLTVPTTASVRGSYRRRR